MELKTLGVNQAFSEFMGKFDFSNPVREKTRNGDVLTFPEPVMWTNLHPRARVLVNPVRQANPYFHVAEVVWMLAGQNNVGWLAQFNKRFYDYAEPDTDEAHGAYGFRWRHHFGFDQIMEVGGMLSSDSSTRRAVMTMWDPRADLGASKNDLPCNTHIYFRAYQGALDMTVCNRSNDVIWGMLGANAVHMTYLLELVAAIANLKVGNYNVMTNNLHLYTWLPNYNELVKQWSWKPDDGLGPVCDVPILGPGERPHDLFGDCIRLVHGMQPQHNNWCVNVAQPMILAYKARKRGEHMAEEMHIERILDDGWRQAAYHWKEWKRG